jgi:protein ImuB
MAEPARYASVWLPHFAAAALARSDPALRGRPLAVLAITPATRPVAEASPEAWAGGIRPGMSAAAAMARLPGLVCRARDPGAEDSAAGALRDLAGGLSPRVEVVSPGDLRLDLAGLEALHGDELRIGTRLVEGGAALDLALRVGLADTRTAAGLAARATRAAPARVTRIPPGGPGAAATVLGPLPLELLAPVPALAASLDRWGIRTLGALAALPTAALAMRLGPEAVRLQRLARGEDDGPFVPHTLPEPCVEALALDWEVTALAALAFVLHRCLERLAARLAVRDAGATALVLTVTLADGTRHGRRLVLPAPLAEPRTLGRLLLAECERWTLPAPVVGLAVLAEPAPLRPLQADFFAPPRPSPRELGETLGRLTALVGPGRVGTPVAADTHRPDAVGVAPFRAEPGRLPARPPVAVTGAALVCRRLTPPRPATVTERDGAPGHVAAAGLTSPVIARAGPWRTAGEWWTDTAWAREEWDVGLADGTACRLVRDLTTGSWAIDAVYD